MLDCLRGSSRPLIEPPQPFVRRSVGWKITSHGRSRQIILQELLGLGLIKQEDIDKGTIEEPACRKYFMHGLGHSLGLGVHDYGVTNRPFEEGWVLTVEPGIYIPEEKLAVRLEDDILLTKSGPVNLSPQIPIEIEEIESIMKR